MPPSPPRRFFLRLAWRCLLPVALFLAGCEQPAAKSDGRVHVAYWEKWTGAEEVALQHTVDAFNRSQNRIFVDRLNIAQIDRKTLLATAGGDPPDVAGLWMYNLPQFSDCDALLPLDDFMRADGTPPAQFMARYSPVYADACTLRGHVWGLPSTPTSYALHWNKTLFRNAGLDPERPPRTVAELDDFARQLTKRDADGRLTQIGFLPQVPGWAGWAYPSWFGGGLFTDGQITAGTRPENLAAYRWVKGYTDRFGRDELRAFMSNAGSFASSQDPFFSGHAAMVLQGVWMNYFIKQYAPGMDYGAAPWPEAVPGVDDFTVADCDMYFIPRGSKHPREAWEFIRYMNSNNPKAESADELQGMELLCFLQEKNSPLREWSPYFTAHHPNPNIALFRQLANSPHAIHEPLMGIWQQYQSEVSNLMDVVGLLIKSPEDALAECQRRMSESWAWHRESMSLREPRPPADGLPRTAMNPLPHP